MEITTKLSTITITELTEVILYPLNFQLPSLLVAENRPATPMPIAHIGSKQQQQQQQQQQNIACPSAPLQSSDFLSNSWLLHIHIRVARLGEKAPIGLLTFWGCDCERGPLTLET